jgi:hypothetical protein
VVRGGRTPEKITTSEAPDVIKYRDNSCEMKKIYFIQTTKYNEYT